AFDPNTATMDPAYSQGQPSTVGEIGSPTWWTGNRPSTFEPVPTKMLASNLILPFPRGELSIDTGRAALTPNTSLTDFGQKGVVLLLVESGVLDVVSEEQLTMSTGGADSSGHAGRLKVDSVGVLNSNAHASLHN